MNDLTGFAKTFSVSILAAKFKVMDFEINTLQDIDCRLDYQISIIEQCLRLDEMDKKTERKLKKHLSKLKTLVAFE